MKKLVLTIAIILGFAIGSFAQELYQQSGGGLFGRGTLPDQQMRDDEAGLFLPGEGLHGIFGNADGTGTNYDNNEWDWQSHLPVTPLGSGALLLIGFGAAYAMARRKKED